MTYPVIRTPRIVALVFTSATLLLCSFTLQAQSKAVTAEELAAHIEKQQAALDAAIENRDNTQKELELKRKALETQEKKQSELETKMKMLCEEQEAVKPGTMDECMASITPK